MLSCRVSVHIRSTIDIRKDLSQISQNKDKKKKRGESSKQKKRGNKYKEQKESLLQTPRQDRMGREPDIPESPEESAAKTNFKRMVFKTIVNEQ